MFGMKRALSFGIGLGAMFAALTHPRFALSTKPLPGQFPVGQTRHRNRGGRTRPQSANYAAPRAGGRSR
jgi:hypothetical protein